MIKSPTILKLKYHEIMKYLKMLLRNEMMRNTEDPQVCMEKVGKSGMF